MAKTKTSPKAKPDQAGPRLRTRSDLGEEATRDISAGLAALLADTFALYLKTKNFHWHMSGPHFRDFHLLLDEQADADLRDDRPDRRARPQDRRR